MAQHALASDRDDPGPELLRRWREGDPAAFTALFRTYRGLVWRVLRRLLRSDPELEDVVQAVFLEVHRALPSFEGRSKLSSWITRVALHVGYHHLRHQRSRPADYRAERTVPDTEDLRASSDPETSVRRRRAAERVDDLLAALPEKKRTVFLLVDIEGMGQEEAAEVIGVNPQTLRTRLFYARKAFWELAADDPILTELLRHRSR